MDGRTSLTLPRGLYALADASMGDPFELAKGLAAAGCRLIQIRAKTWSVRDLIERGHRIVPKLVESGVVLIINDHIEAAKELGASGVHLGQEDAQASVARARLGPHAILGLSTHDLEQVKAAEGVDYLGFGPIFSTHTKAHAGSPRGMEFLAKAVRATSLPVIAIGGLSADRIPGLRATGVHGWAVASGLFISGTLNLEKRWLS
jgi:thiamine-phosphate pyrophosphorylase